MKIIHTADIHLGAAPDRGCPWSEERRRSIVKTFIKLIEKVRTEKADLLVIAGDLFHAPPSREDVRKVNSLFETIPETAVVLCAGNHDHITRERIYPEFKWAANVYGLWSRGPESLPVPGKDVRVYGLSYYDNEACQNLYAGVEKEGSEKYHVLVMHGGDAKHSPFSKSFLSDPDFDYIALGHIHKPGYVLKNKAYYSGGLDPIDKNDTGEHGYIRAELDGTGVRASFVPFSSYSYEHISVRTDENDTVRDIEERILSRAEELGGENSYCVELTGISSCSKGLDHKRLWRHARILEIIDKTEAVPDGEIMSERYAGSFLERYIREFDGRDDEISRIALEKGIKAIREHMK